MTRPGRAGPSCQLAGSSRGTHAPACGTSSRRTVRLDFPDRPSQGRFGHKQFSCWSKQALRFTAGWNFTAAQVSIKLGKGFSLEDVKDQSGERMNDCRPDFPGTPRIFSQQNCIIIWAHSWPLSYR